MALPLVILPVFFRDIIRWIIIAFTRRVIVRRLPPVVVRLGEEGMQLLLLLVKKACSIITIFTFSRRYHLS